MSDQLARVHLIAIGGAGMSGIARILLARGAQVSGSDAKDSRTVLALRAQGAKIAVGHDPVNLDQLPGGPTAVVISSAIRETNPELVEARRRGIPVLHRSAALAALMSGYRAACITGTHGKTSTTSMLTVALQHCGLDPSFAIGGDLNESGANAHHGSGDIFVAEVDESDGSFLAFTPDVAVVTNVEVDHLDHHGTPEAYVAAFDAFAARIAHDGVLVVCTDDPGSAALADRVQASGVTVRRYGRFTAGDADAKIQSYRPVDGGGVASIELKGSTMDVQVAVPGEHMAANAIGALLAGIELGAPIDRLLTGLAAFGGVRRRFEFKGNANGVRVYDDYAHHPTEVAAVIRSARPVAGSGRIIVVFQPHLYSRTREFAVQFGQTLGLADVVVVLDVYAAREDPVPGVTGELVVNEIPLPIDRVHYQPSFEQVPTLIADLSRPGDVVITMGAGDVTMLAPEVVSALHERDLIRE